MLLIPFVVYIKDMFAYYGSKGALVDYYPKPKHDKIIEPFAGAAKYSLKYFDHEVILYDKYEVIVDIWKYLIEATPKDILSLPDINRDKGQKISDFENLTDVERNLLKFMISSDDAIPSRLTPSVRNRYSVLKKQISVNVMKVKHWKVFHGSYEDIENQEATWFIDPPYQTGGHLYKHSNKDIDFKHLGEWCKSRSGQVIVCENNGADWLPFIPLKTMRQGSNINTEVVWYNKEIQPKLF